MTTAEVPAGRHCVTVWGGRLVTKDGAPIPVVEVSMPLQAVQSPLAQFYSEQTALTDPAERFVFERVPRRDVWFQFKGESPMLAAPESVVAPGRWDGVKLERRRTLTLIPGEITEARPL